jgi:peptidoglycan/xylan/chitin deacetylase (PgdA/CDA1 family)
MQTNSFNSLIIYLKSSLKYIIVLAVVSLFSALVFYWSLFNPNRLCTTKDILFRFPNFKTHALVMSYDDGHYNDTIVIELFNKYNIKGTFNITLDRTTQYQDNSVFIHKNELASIYTGHEVASHGVTHKNLSSLTDSLQYLELTQSKNSLSNYTHKKVLSIAYPYGKYNSSTIKHAKQSLYLAGRSIQNTYDFTIPNNLLQWHPTCEDIHALKYTTKFLKQEKPFVTTIKNRIFSKLGFSYSNLKLMTIWGHSHLYTSSDSYQWKQLETLCRKLANHNHVWYVTAYDFADYIKVINNLIITKYEVYNPIESKRNVYFTIKKHFFTLHPGETFNIKDYEFSQY